MIGTVPTVPRVYTPVERGIHVNTRGLPVEAYITAGVLNQTRPERDGSLESVNAHHDWRKIVGAFVQQYAADYKTFNERVFRELAGWDR